MWVIKSYNRPAHCYALMKQLIATGMTTPGILFVNGCDMKKEYEKVTLPDNWKRIWHDPNIGCNAPLNEVFRRFPEEPWYGCIDDDEWIYSNGWDKKLIAAAGDWNIAHADDGWQSPRRLQSFVTIGGELMRAAGWWTLPGLWHYHGEEVWEALDRECGLGVFRWDVKADHKHWRNNKGQMDATYNSSGLNRYEDMLLFKKFMRHEFEPLVKRIKTLRALTVE